MRYSLLLISSVALAQSTGKISGTTSAMVDGGPLAKVLVQAKNASGATYSATSTSNGSYTLALPAGTYELTASLPAMVPVKRASIVVGPASPVRLDLRLEDVQINTLGESRSDYDGSSRVPPPGGPMPRLSDGKPDLSGVWYAVLTVDEGKPEPLPWAEALWKQRVENNHKDNLHSRCLPNGVGYTGMFGDFRLVQGPGILIILDELGQDLPRQVFMDGRGHPSDPDPTWYGHSVAKWDGDTLVIDTVGLNGKTWVDPRGLPTTERFHTVERFRRKDMGHLELELTIDDPGAYKKAWTMKKITTLAPRGEELMEYVCEENNRDLEHMVGK